MQRAWLELNSLRGILLFSPPSPYCFSEPSPDCSSHCLQELDVSQRTTKSGEQHVPSSKVLQVHPTSSAQGCRGCRAIRNAMLTTCCLVQMEDLSVVCYRMIPDNVRPLPDTNPQAPPRKTRMHSLLKRWMKVEAKQPPDSFNLKPILALG